MSEIDKAIEFTKKNIGICKKVQATRERLELPEAPLATEIHETILKCLEEQQQREQGCEYCQGNWNNKKALMKNGKGDYFVKINDCMYLEDNEKGNKDFKYSLFGQRINFCPMCRRRLSHE